MSAFSKISLISKFRNSFNVELKFVENQLSNNLLKFKPLDNSAVDGSQNDPLKTEKWVLNKNFEIHPMWK